MDHQGVRKVVQGWKKRAHTRRLKRSKLETHEDLKTESDANPKNGEVNCVMAEQVDSSHTRVYESSGACAENPKMLQPDQKSIPGKERWRRIMSLVQQKPTRAKDLTATEEGNKVIENEGFSSEARRFTISELSPEPTKSMTVEVRSSSFSSTNEQELLPRRSHRKSGKELWKRCMKSLKKKTRRSDSKSPIKIKKTPASPPKNLPSPNTLRVDSCLSSTSPKEGRAGSPKSPKDGGRVSSVLEKFKNASVILNRGMSNLKEKFMFDDSQRFSRKIRVEFGDDEGGIDAEEESVALDNPDYNYTTSMIMTSLKDGRFMAAIPLDILPSGDITIRVRNYRMEIIVGKRASLVDDRHRITQPVKYGDIDVPIYVSPQSLRFHMDSVGKKLCVSGYTKGCWFTGRRVSFGEPACPPLPIVKSPTLSRAESLGCLERSVCEDVSSTSGIWA